MKKYRLLLLFATLGFFSGQAQKLSHKEANRIVQECLLSLSRSDTAAFQQLWLVDHSPWPYHSRAYTRKDVTASFFYLQQFLDTALVHNMPALAPEITKIRSRQEERPFGEYHVQVWFSYSKVYQKGFGLYLVFHHGEWKCRFDPETSWQYTGRASS